jgi:hypothetical protein
MRKAVTALEQQPGGTISMSGSVSVVRQLLAAGLLDDGDAVPLKLLSSQTFSTGVLNLVYAPATAPGDAGYEEAKAHLPQ